MSDKSKECPTCHQKPASNGQKLTFAIGALALGALAFVASGFDDRMDKLDIVLQREIQAEADARIAGDLALEKQIDENLRDQHEGHAQMHTLVERNDGWIRDHIEGHP